MNGIVVGVDGSAESKEALTWALAEGRLRRCPVHVVHVWTYEPGGGIGIAPPPVSAFEVLREAAEETLEALVAEVAGESPTVEIERAVVEGEAAPVLIDASADADLLVLGARGRGGFAALLLGSVGDQCARHARCPVVIVRGAAKDDSPQ